jgi:hypothetical protein
VDELAAVVVVSPAVAAPMTVKARTRHPIELRDGDAVENLVAVCDGMPHLALPYAFDHPWQVTTIAPSRTATFQVPAAFTGLGNVWVPVRKCSLRFTAKSIEPVGLSSVSNEMTVDFRPPR